MTTHPWTFLPGGRVQCHEHHTITYGGTCRQCDPRPPRIPVPEVAEALRPIPDSVPLASPYDA